MPQPQSWGEVYSLHTSVSVAGVSGQREFAFRLSSTAIALATNLSVGRAVSENPVVLQGFPELAQHYACQETAYFISECPDSLQTSAPWRFGVEPKTTSLFS